MFTPSRLAVARKRRGMTRSRLKQVTGISLRSLSLYESGLRDPSPQTIDCIARGLEYPAEFFSRPHIDEPVPDSVTFRALASMTASQRGRVLAAAALAVELSGWIRERFNVPDPAIPDLSYLDPESAADTLRGEWGLGARPIRNMVHLLEARGVHVFSVTEEERAVDAFSFWQEDRPLVCLNTRRSGERQRFDAAHELAHLVLHPHHGTGRERGAERDADKFASSFLMPRASVLAVAPRGATLAGILNLKRNWNVSALALTHRLHAIGLLTDWAYRDACIQLGKMGYKRAEPGGMPPETSQVFGKVFAALREDGSSRSVIARDLALPLPELDALLFGLVLVGVTGARRTSGQASTGLLRLVGDDEERVS
jgi:Zn-dependent peptidase ImmA (M78 family)/DNA-binding XRE family transcriptional regulator